MAEEPSRPERQVLASFFDYLALKERKFRHWVFAAIVVIFASAWIGKSIGIWPPDVSLGITVAIAIFLLMVAVRDLKELEPRSDVQIFRSETPDVVALQARRVKNARVPRVRLLEYSAMTIHPVLQELARLETVSSIRLLVGNPSTSNLKQHNRILESLCGLTRFFPPQTARARGLRIKCYSEPASIRGRDYGERLVALGQYTHQKQTDVQPEGDLWGHLNPLIIASKSSPEGQELADHFDTVFEAMWKTAKPLKEVYRCDQNYPLRGEWLDAIS